LPLSYVSASLETNTCQDTVCAPARRDEHTARAKDKDERQPSQKKESDENSGGGNRWNPGLIDARYDGVFHDDFAAFS
jgi:hypothetical protein